MAKKKSGAKQEEETFEVERIVDHKKEKGKFQYFVKWNGYDESENTWEHEKNLQGCPEILADYKQLMLEDEPEVASPKKASPKKRKSNTTASPAKRSKRDSSVDWKESDVKIVKEMDKVGGEVEVTLVLKKAHTVIKCSLDDCRFRCPQL